MKEAEKKGKAAKGELTAENYLALYAMQEMTKQGILPKNLFQKILLSYGNRIDRTEFSCYA